MCTKQLKKSLDNANATLIGRKRYEDYDEAKIAATFKKIDQIHLERGRKMDQRLRQYDSQIATYDAAYDKTPEESSGGEVIDADMPPSPQDETDAQN